mgnify:CR=1 FL=1
MNTLINTIPARQVKRRSPEARRRRARLKASGHSMAAVQRLARTSYRAVQYFYDVEKWSPRIAAAHRALTGDDVQGRVAKAS